MNTHPSSQEKPPRRRIWFLRLLVYSFLVLVLTDYFFIHPSKITHDQLPSPSSELRPLVNRLQGHVQYLASSELKGRKAGTPGNKLAEQYLVDQFTQLGLATPAPGGRRTQNVAPAIGNNVFSALTPIHPSRQWLVLGAHFDHLGEEGGDVFLGADDNAGSVAILLETARRLQQPPALEKFNVLLVGFNSEEPPHFLTHLMGSNQFMMRIREIGLERDKIQMAVIMDLMGGVHWKPLQDSVFALGAEKSPELETLLPKLNVAGLEIRRLGMHMVESTPSAGRTAFSDYDVFRNREIPFLFLSSGRTPHYHRSTDTLEKLHYARMARSVLWLEKLIRAVAKMPGPLTFHRSRENFVQDFNVVYPMIQEASRWAGKVPETGWVTLYKLKQDRARLERIKIKIQTDQPLNQEDGRALSLASIRLQCLLGNMGPCFLLPGQN